MKISDIFSNIDQFFPKDLDSHMLAATEETKSRTLWRAVILQAIIDILTESDRTENKIAKFEAKQWIFINNDDFAYVCNMAGYTKEYVRKKTMEIMRMNLNNRLLINRTDIKNHKYMNKITG